MTNLPLVSLLIPCYNHRDFLDDCMRSVLAQTYENIEVLICDDASPDGSFEKLLSYEPALRQRFANVSLQRNAVNRGVTGNLNRMLQEASGAYIKILASDDCMKPEAIEKMVAALEAEPAAGVAVCNGEKVPEEQHYPDFLPGAPVYTEAPDFSPKGFAERVALRNDIFAPGAMIRKTVFNRFGLFDETLTIEDYEFWMRILLRGNVRFLYLPEQLLYYRISAGSITAMQANAGLERRRRRFHSGEMDTLAKLRSELPRKIYALAAAERILQERWIAKQAGLTQWEAELRQRWQQFDCKKDIPFKDKLRILWRHRRLDRK